MKIRKAILIAPLVLATSLLPVSASAQNRNYPNRNSNFYNGVRHGGHGGHYYDDHNRNQGGIGPGKGALIGAGGGAVLGAVFGGGLKGTIIGGAAGAGIGAVIGKANQDNQRDHYYDHHRR